MKNLLSTASIEAIYRLPRLNYAITVFGLGSAPDPARGAHDALPYSLVGWRGYTAPHFHVLLLLNWYPHHFLNNSYASTLNFSKHSTIIVNVHRYPPNVHKALDGVVFIANHLASADDSRRVIICCHTNYL